MSDSGSVRQRLVDQIQQVGEGRLLGVDVEDAGEDFVVLLRFHQRAHRIGLVGGVVVLVQLAQAQAEPSCICTS